MDPDDIYEDSIWEAYSARAPFAFRPEIPQQQHSSGDEKIILLAEEISKLRSQIAAGQDGLDPAYVFLITAACAFGAGLATGFLLRHLLRRNL